jgi:hypothetical protein
VSGEKHQLSTRRKAGAFRYHQGLKEDSMEFDGEDGGGQNEDQKDTVQVSGDKNQVTKASRVPQLDNTANEGYHS